MGGLINTPMRVTFDTNTTKEKDEDLSLDRGLRPDPEPSNLPSNMPLPPPSMNQHGLQHMTYHCPGFTGKGSQMSIESINFQRLFEELPPICIPLFQRTYCWSDKQILGWWSDAQGLGSRGSMVLGGCHGTGKCVFKRYIDNSTGNPFLLCIDGQQRCTTFQLMLSALRDALLNELRAGNVLNSRNMHEKVIRSSVSTLVSLDQLLFRNSKGANEWAQKFAQLSKDKKKSHLTSEQDLCTHFDTVWNEMLPMGVIPDNITPSLTPSFADRCPFFACLLGGLCAQESWRCASLDEVDGHSAPTQQSEPAVVGDTHGHVSENRQAKVANAVMESYMKRWGGSRQVAAKRHFDTGIQTILHSKGLKRTSHSISGSDDRCKEDTSNDSVTLNGDELELVLVQEHEMRLRVLVSESKRLMKRFSLIMSEVISDINLPQVFLWLQEKSLFGMGSLLFNPTPGVKFHACDLVRNLLLSPVVQDTYQQDDHNQNEEGQLKDKTKRSKNEVKNNNIEGSHSGASSSNVPQASPGASSLPLPSESSAASHKLAYLHLSAEEDMYRREWLEPLELKLQASDQLDACISAFLDQKKFNQSALPYVRLYPALGQFERTLSELEESEYGQYVCQEQSRSTGMGLYARFVTAMEELEISIRNNAIVTSSFPGHPEVSHSSESEVMNRFELSKDIIHKFEQFGSKHDHHNTTVSEEEPTSGNSRMEGSSHETVNQSSITLSPEACAVMLRELRSFAVIWQKKRLEDHTGGVNISAMPVLGRSISDRERAEEASEAHSLMY